MAILLAFFGQAGVLDPLVMAADAFVPTTGEGSTLSTEEGQPSLPRSLINEQDQFVGLAELEPAEELKGPHWTGPKVY